KCLVTGHLWVIVAQGNRGETGEKIQQFPIVLGIVDGNPAAAGHVKGHVVSVCQDVSAQRAVYFSGRNGKFVHTVFDWLVPNLAKVALICNYYCVPSIPISPPVWMSRMRSPALK